MDDRNLSTNTTIPCIIRSGHISQSPFSETFIKAVEEKLNVDIVACYVQTGEYNTLIKGKPTEDFVDEVLVTFFVREASLHSIQVKNHEEIEAIFWNTLRSFDLQSSFTRVYSPEELAYYGFANIPRREWDMEKVQKPPLAPRKSFAVKLESFDRLALYHLLSDKVASVGRYIRKAYEVNVKIYVGFLNHTATHFIVFNAQKEYEYFLSLAHPDTVLSAIQDILKAQDHWNVLNTCSYCPQYRVWDQLSGEEKMCLLREAHD